MQRGLLTVKYEGSSESPATVNITAMLQLPNKLRFVLILNTLAESDKILHLHNALQFIMYTVF